jgi:hypothetical protein
MKRRQDGGSTTFELQERNEQTFIAQTGDPMMTWLSFGMATCAWQARHWRVMSLLLRVPLAVGW